MSAPAEQDLALPKEGDILASKYRVERILGRGGMGVVVAASHLQLGQRVAIKFLLQNDVREIVARFLREARAAVRLRNEHVARVLDVGQLENGAPYMVMEYLDGHDLSRRVKTMGPLPAAEAVDYLLQTCEAIAEAHAAGIIHRDLKPANLFLTTTPDGSTSVKVLDFGISKVKDAEDEGGDGMQLTRTSMVLGSPLYMSPEQLTSSKDVDPRSDIWSLGVILYQLLAGRVPFNAPGFPELVLKINMEPPMPLSMIRGDVPSGLEAAILKCLEKKRENRFANIAELAWAIVDFGPPRARLSAEKSTRVLEAAGMIARPPSHPSVTPPPTSTGALASTVATEGNTVSSLPTVARVSVPRARKSSAAAIGLVIVTLGLTGTGMAVFLRKPATAPTSASVPDIAVRDAPESSAPTSAPPDVLPSSEPSSVPNAPSATSPSTTASASAKPQAATRPSPPPRVQQSAKASTPTPALQQQLSPKPTATNNGIEMPWQ